MEREDESCRSGQSSDPNYSDEALIALKRKIERQTGFPAELKTAEIILKAGWSYQSNPRVKFVDAASGLLKFLEVDFVATTTVEEPTFSPALKDGYFKVSVVIDVKKYSRPILVFSSPLTSSDHSVVYADLTKIEDDGAVRSHFYLANWAGGPFGGATGGRSAVVINNEGDRPKDYDFHQIYSTLDGLYEACKAVRKEHREDQKYFSEWHGFKTIHAIIPIVVCDGVVLEYRVESKTSKLSNAKIASITSHILGEDDRLATCCAYIISIDYLGEFLRGVRSWARSLDPKSLELSFEILQRDDV